MILIIDINHGALDIAKEYYNLDHRDIFIWDIYGKLKKDKTILKKYNEVIKYFNIIPSEGKPDFSKYEEVVAPIHCPIDWDFTPFHDAISKIIKIKYNNLYKKFIEITGVKGKTTTTELIYKILSNEYNVFINNSNRGSITPVSVINSINLLSEKNTLDSYDVFIFEVSLGITSCRYGALINILENYPIGGGLRDSFIAKMSSMKNAERAYINKRVFEEYSYRNFEDIKLNNLIEIDDKNIEILSKYPLRYRYNGRVIEFNREIFGTHYIENSLFAINICKNFMDLDEIVDRVYSFKIKNRMSISSHNPLIIENVNPGLDVKAIDHAINDFKGVFNRGIVVIGGDFGCTCEEIDMDRLVNVVKKYNKHFKFIFTGPLGRKLRKYIEGTYLDKLDNIYKKYPSENTLILYRKSIN